MGKNVGACGLCRKVGELRDSHLLPAAVYELARDPARTNPNPVMVTGGRAFTTSRQVKAPFLCDDCEQRFSDRGERYVLGQCARPDGFKLRELLEGSVPLADERQFRLYDVAALLGGHADEHLYFGASVFWRASARAWSPFSLGDIYDEQFRLYLLGRGKSGSLVSGLAPGGQTRSAPRRAFLHGGAVDETEDGGRSRKFVPYLGTH
jgi:hypothetical protein